MSDSEVGGSERENIIPMTDEQRERNRERLMERYRNGESIIEIPSRTSESSDTTDNQPGESA